MATKKTTKPAAESKTKKPATTKKTVARKPVHTEEDIRKKAEEIYYERIALGEHGTPEEDWAKAEQLLKASKKKKI